MPLTLAAKLKFAAEVARFIKNGYRGTDFALDDCSWCKILGHGERAVDGRRQLFTWAAGAFPELEIELSEDERGRDPAFEACCWFLSVRVKD